MAQFTPAPARLEAVEAFRTRLALQPTVLAVAALALALSACSGPRFATVNDRPAEEPALGAANDAYASSYTSIVPRAFINFEDLDENAPNHYTVVSGDTLWDISDRFLKKPWLWSTLWNYNPDIANPHLIYPGDELKLEYVNNRPSLVLSRNGKPLVPTAGNLNVGPNGEPLLGAATPGTERLSPRIRSESLEEAIPMVEADSLASFLLRPSVVEPSDIKGTPYVVGNDDGRLASAAGHEIYIRGDVDPSVTEYSIYRPDKWLEDPSTGEFLGQQLTHVADARLLAIGDPSTLVIIANEMETIAGDIVMPKDTSAVIADFTPRLPDIRGDGRIVSLVNSIVQTGRDQIVVLNLGERSGVQAGDMLAIESRGGSFVDERSHHSYEQVSMPSQRTGVVLVFQTFDKVSYGLVMESTRPIRANDFITGI